MRPCTFQASVMCCPSPDSAAVLPRRKTQEGARALFFRSKCDTARIQFGQKTVREGRRLFPIGFPKQHMSVWQEMGSKSTTHEIHEEHAGDAGPTRRQGRPHRMGWGTAGLWRQTP